MSSRKSTVRALLSMKPRKTIYRCKAYSLRIDSIKKRSEVCKINISDVYVNELSALTQRRTTKQTAQYQSGDNWLTKCVGLFLYSYWFMRKLILKFENGKFL